ncbi:MAG TPA: diguanylate cyclase [Gammaproteobacteria bacterium]|nr:diguanylate cyclase [Gammaproteobacteria bacterium]
MSKSLNDKIEAIRSEFVKSLPIRVGKIQNLAGQLLNDWDIEISNQLLQELHNLRGVSGGHGFMVLTQMAENIEAIVDAANENDAAHADAKKQPLQAAITELINRANYVYDTFEIPARERDLTPSTTVSTKMPLILIVDDDMHFCDMVAIQLEHLGYRTRSIYSLSQLSESILNYRPNAIFMDIIFDGNRDAGTQIITDIREKEEITCPIIYMSARDDMQARLNAVRSGGTAFLCKTFNLGDLKNILDIIIPLQQDVSYKVLIIDDDKISSAYCSTILEHAGIQVSSIDNPEKVFEQIINFDPDVILLDMYMPSISGVEMASIIRQHQNFSSIPIIIMSGETDINKQFKMRSAGADDFILKPFKPHHLVDTILNRIQRSRQTKHLIYTDGLTGLMLFSKVKDQINNLLESCIRYNLEFSLALIDLDHFKNINDSYGHLNGDQILRHFAEFLLGRVRKSDIVTRSGGEEFTIIFPYTSGENALRAVNSFREAYSQRLQHLNNADVKVTFSAGISSINNYHDLESMLAAADQSLYHAKESGRNSSELAD